MRAAFSTEPARLEAFSDGVIAVIITIMVLELKAPHGEDLAAAEFSRLATYVVSFVFVGIYWNNHHHMLHATRGVDGRVMWANLHLLFWLSLVPFTTSWLGENPLGRGSHGALRLRAALGRDRVHAAARRAAGRERPRHGLCARRRGRREGEVSLAIYVCGIGFAFVSPKISDVLFVVVAILWFIPDRRFEPVIAGAPGTVRNRSRSGRRRGTGRNSDD